MSITKHTPGPWEAKFTSGAGLSVHANVSKALGPRYSHDCPIYHTASDSVGLSIAYELWTQFPRAEWESMQQANARLIAAAPELLELIRISIGNVRSLGPAGALARVDAPYQEWLRQLEAVYAKATNPIPSQDTPT